MSSTRWSTISGFSARDPCVYSVAVIYDPEKGLWPMVDSGGG